MPIVKKLKAKVAPGLTRAELLERCFAFVAVLILGGTSIVWSFLGARVQSGNADQLINAYLFKDGYTLTHAIMPSAHTFLLKWPLFYLLGLGGPSHAALVASTIMVSLLTVGGLAYIMYRIERRPLMFGLLMLALASMLLLVPPQPVAGTLLPVNMAMITTRNLEYLLYLVSLALLIQAPKRLKSWKLWTAIGGLGLLVASDNLFLSMSVGGAVIAIATYAILRRWPLVRLSAIWLGASVAAGLLAMGLLWGISAAGLTHIGSTAVGTPYGLVQSPKDVGLGIIYGVLGLLTNLGANPAFDAISVKTIAATVRDRLVSPYGLAFVANVVLALVGLGAAIKLFWSRPLDEKKRLTISAQPDTAVLLSAMLAFSVVAALGAFVVTNHYYVVDARYLAIVLFAVAVGAATFWRNKPLPSRRSLAWISAGMLCSISLGIACAVHVAAVDRDAHQTITARNDVVAQALQKHQVHTLLGDYWRVLPIKSAALTPMDVVPFEGCTKPREVLTSDAWQKNYLQQSFAYLLTFDQKISDFPNCTFDQIVAEYGKPNASFLVAGTLDSPKELLMFYDNGSRQSSPIQTAKPSSATVLPIPPDQLPRTDCPNGAPTIMNVVAHQDDDLLFLSPDLLHDIKAGHCVRTVYVTAGDAGNDRLYWLGRERGSEAAYASMLGLPEDTTWVQRIVKLSPHQFATVANPRGNAYVSLVFLHLPDGNLNGQGFKASHDESLERLESGHIKEMHSVDGQSTYTSDDLVDVLNEFMSTYNPATVHTQAPRDAGTRFNDHSDHLTVGRYAERAFARYKDNMVTAGIAYYIGYPIRERSQNVFGDDLLKKASAFTTYGKFDSSVCHTFDRCEHVPTYGSYLRGQYTLSP